MDDAFAAGQTPEEREIWRNIGEWNREAATKAEQELFAQTTRLNTAQRALQTKVTKKAQEDVRIATNKIVAAKQKLADLRRTDDTLPRDSRVFPGMYAPVMIWEDGRRVIKPMRYFCRLPGWTEAVERKFPGTYNARRDKLETSWKDLFGYQHGIMVADVFYENIEGPNGENQVLAFTPKTAEPMLIACLWNRSPGYKGAPDLYSFAAITDEPEPEVAEAGHDRTIINIKPEHMDAWLQPDAGNLPANVQEAVEAMFDGEDAMPPPASDIERWQHDPDYSGGFWMLIDVDLSKVNTRAVRLNISLPENLVQKIDGAAKARRLSRSAFLALAAEDEIAGSHQ